MQKQDGFQIQNTYNNLFIQNFDNYDVITDYDDAIMKGMVFGTDLPNNCMLFKAKDTASVYLTDDLDGIKQKRHIADPTGAQIDGK